MEPAALASLKFRSKDRGSPNPLKCLPSSFRWHSLEAGTGTQLFGKGIELRSVDQFLWTDFCKRHRDLELITQMKDLSVKWLIEELAEGVSTKLTADGLCICFTLDARG